MLDPFSILKHLPPPQLEEVVRVGIELPSVPPVVSELIESLEGRWSVAARVRREHGRRHTVAGE